MNSPDPTAANGGPPGDADSPTPGTGLPGLDQILQGLRPGDNVVWQITSMDDYRLFVAPFVREALTRKNRLIYFRFATHPPLVSAPGADVHPLDPEEGFESFISGILDTIEAAGEYACYVFDSLSDLAVDWHSDRMLGNFFLLACPFLYQLKTIAYFGLIRNRHSFHATDAIEKTAQVILNVQRSGEKLFVQPVKVDGRYSRTMFLPHLRDGETFRPVTRSATATEALAGAPPSWTDFSIHRPGIWQHTMGQAARTPFSDSFSRAMQPGSPLA